jgi:hypothetical protein
MRVFLATLLLFIAIFGIPKVGSDTGPSPLPTPRPSPTPDAAPVINVPEPTREMKDAVEKVAAAMKDANIIDRMMWAQVWAKAAKAVAADSTDDKIVWADTTALRKFTETALRIGWRRLGNNPQGKYPGLSDAVEAAFSSILTNRVQAVTPELRKRYVELCNAIAWAGVGRDQ